MPHTHHKIWLHFIWATKERVPLISDELENRLSKHMKDYATRNEIEIDVINAVADQIHLLITLIPDQSPSRIVNLLKGESSNWINRNNLIKPKFSWQRGYSVFSVSSSNVRKVRKYIEGQKEHHRKRSYLEEVQDFLREYNVKKVTP